MKFATMDAIRSHLLEDGKGSRFDIEVIMGEPFFRFGRNWPYTVLVCSEYTEASRRSGGGVQFFEFAVESCDEVEIEKGTVVKRGFFNPETKQLQIVTQEQLSA